MLLHAAHCTYSMHSAQCSNVSVRGTDDKLHTASGFYFVFCAVCCIGNWKSHITTVFSHQQQQPNQ